MARAVLHYYADGVARNLWPFAMVWAAQRVSQPNTPPYGARMVVRHTPKTQLGKLAARTEKAISLHWST